MITLILPVSCEQGFENLRKSLFNLSTDIDQRTNILIVAYSPQVYLEARNYMVEYAHIGEALVVYSEKKNLLVALDHLGNKDEYIFIWNENTVVTQGALMSLYHSYLEYPRAGFITGILFGEDIPYWVKDIYSERPRLIKRSQRKEKDNLVDTTYPFCMMTKTEHFKDFFFKSRSKVGFGLSLRRAGFQNYMDKTAISKYVEAK